MSKDEYLITDAPLKALTVFAMPMILGSFFQQVYNMADSIIVGQFVGSSALAAVGACAALTNVFICVALGAGVGAGVLVSRCFGAKEYGKMKTIVSTSLISFLLLSIILGVFGFCFSHAMMSGLQTPADILEEAVLYLRVYFVGFPFLFMYNILSTMFTSIGESKIPLGLLIFSSILNIVMDLWMVAGLGLGVFGAALATLIAQGISAVFSLLIFFYRMRRYFRKQAVNLILSVLGFLQSTCLFLLCPYSLCIASLLYLIHHLFFVLLYCLSPILQSFQYCLIQHIITDIVHRTSTFSKLSVVTASIITVRRFICLICRKPHRPATIRTLDKPCKYRRCFFLCLSTP